MLRTNSLYTRICCIQFFYGQIHYIQLIHGHGFVRCTSSLCCTSLHILPPRTYLWNIFLDISLTLFLKNTVTEHSKRSTGNTYSALTNLQPHTNLAPTVKQSCVGLSKMFLRNRSFGNQLSFGFIFWSFNIMNNLP